MKKTFCIVMAIMMWLGAAQAASQWYSGQPADWTIWALSICGSILVGMHWMEFAFPQLRGDD